MRSFLGVGLRTISGSCYVREQERLGGEVLALDGARLLEVGTQAGEETFC